MRLFILAMSVLTISVVAQDNKQGTIKGKKKPGSNEVYPFIDQMPVFQGGDMQLSRFIQDNLLYPISALENGLSGTVYITFIIRQNGNIENAIVLRGITGCPECDAEALRVVNLMPPFIPGKKDGSPASVQFNLSFRFRLK
jgi:protein TonB